MKNLIPLIGMLLFISCKNEGEKTIKDELTEVTENTVVATKEGNGKIILNCNGKAISVEGICGGVITMGTLTIVVKDKTNPAKVLTIDFNTDQYPENEKEYLIKPKDYASDNKPENEVSVSFMEGLPNNKMNVWDPQETSGKLQFTVNGNEIKCTLKDIKLKPGTIYNAEDLQKEGVVSGELTLYKN